eukprot:EG_transcript_25335
MCLRAAGPLARLSLLQAAKVVNQPPWVVRSHRYATLCNPFQGRATPEIRPELAPLVREHKVVESMLETFGCLLVLLEEADTGGADPQPLSGDLLQLLQLLDQYLLQHHHPKEDRILFEAMVQSGFPTGLGPVPILAREHAVMKRMVTQLHGLCAAGDVQGIVSLGTRFGDLLRQHINKENDVVLPLASERLSDTACAGIAKAFQAMEEDDPLVDLEEQARALHTKYSF